MKTSIPHAAASPFHKGEQEVQTRMGVRDQMEQFGKRVIRDYMPEQHREFYKQLPFVLVGHADKDGWPWASILFSPPGFIQSNEDTSLLINTKPVAGDPLEEALVAGTRLGLLGIELASRRRNRLAAHITRTNKEGFELQVDQAFGNCPQYIQTRDLHTIDPSSLPPPNVEDLKQFDESAKNLIMHSDTFFVASYVKNDSGEASEGADVSHRGGRPGFVRIDDDLTLTIPDYLGNNHFNTFGNFTENAKAGLLFLDFENGHLLSLTGTVEILWDSPDSKYFEGAERLWKFHLDHGRRLTHALPLRWALDAFSPNSLLTGTWKEADALSQAERYKNEWRPYTIKRVVQESSVITSFYLAADGHQAVKFLPGQFLAMKAIIKGKEHRRTYTLSSAPADDTYRISVKRETSVDGKLPEGVFSNYLHSHVKEGDTIYAKAPSGEFTFSADIARPAILLAAGVGMTPMISIAKHVLIEGLRTRSTRPLIIVGAARNHEQRAFFEELNDISQASRNKISTYWALSETSPTLKPGKDFHHQGRISKDLLQSILPIDDYDCYLCGPSGFMQSSYDLLRSLGVRDARIYAEAFGPASLKRDTDHTNKTFDAGAMADQAIIEFSDSQVEQAWAKGDGSLLEFAEAHGFTPEFGCRNGQCGACKTQLISGKVTYQTEQPSPVDDNEVLLCCSVPAASEGEDIVKVSLKL
jgi:uncharacterized protein